MLRRFMLASVLAATCCLSFVGCEGGANQVDTTEGESTEMQSESAPGGSMTEMESGSLGTSNVTN